MNETPTPTPTGQEVIDILSRALRPSVDADQVRAIAREEAKAALAFAPPLVLRMEAPDGGLLGEVTGAHESLPGLLARISGGIRSLFLAGPAGCGKTRLAADAARALGLGFSSLSCSAGATESDLLGRTVLRGGETAWEASAFISAYESGGVFLLDEVDAGDANLMLTLNRALDDVGFSNPRSGRDHVRHPMFTAIAAANTWGHGATAEYCGRSPLDGAFLDRFAMGRVAIGYDLGLEARLAPEPWIRWVATARQACAEHRIRQILSTRTVVRGGALLAAGWSMAEVISAACAGWPAADFARLEPANREAMSS